MEKNTWSRSETIMLIELYKACTVLYTPSHCSYLNKSKKDECWIHILREVKKKKPFTNLPEIKIKIRTLRQQYSKQRALVLQAKENGSSDVYVPSLWCYKQLQFFEKSVDDYLSPILSTSTSEEPIFIKDSPSLDGTQWSQESPSETTHSTVQSPQQPPLSLDGYTISELEAVETNEARDKEKFKSHDLHFMVTAALKLVQESAKRKKETVSEKKSNAFGQYIAQELSKIEDEEIAEDTQFSMILLIRDALKKDRQQRKS